MNVSNLFYPETLNGKRVMFTPFSKNGVSLAAGGTLVAGISDTRIVIHALAMVATSACALAFWRSNTNMLGPINLAANGQLILPFSPFGWMQASHGQTVNFWTDVAATVVGVVIYTEVD
jgi:hypothetical protein